MKQCFVPTAPKRAVGLPAPEDLFSEPLIEAYASLCRHLWPALRAQPWWGGDPARSVLAAHAAADFLDRLGIEAVTLSGTLSVFAYDSTNESIPTEAVAVGKVTPLSPTTHALVLIRDSGRAALLETALFQMQQPQFCRLPDMAMVPVLPEALKSLLSSEDNFLSPALDHLATWRAPDRCPQHGWVLDVVWARTRHRSDWSTHPDADAAKAKAAADWIARARRRARQ